MDALRRALGLDRLTGDQLHERVHGHEPSRVAINIDPNVRRALRGHLMGTKYGASGVGYSEWIRQMLLIDGADERIVPERVRKDTRAVEERLLSAEREES